MTVDPKKSFNREEQYLASIAGLENKIPKYPWSRKEAYLSAIDGKMNTIEAQIAALATDISFKGSVSTVDALPASAAVGDAYITEDTGIIYVYVGDTSDNPWVALGGSSGGGLKVLSTDDYNSGQFVEFAYLSEGIYLVDDFSLGLKMGGEDITGSNGIFIVPVPSSSEDIYYFPTENYGGEVWIYVLSDGAFNDKISFLTDKSEIGPYKVYTNALTSWTQPGTTTGSLYSSINMSLGSKLTAEQFRAMCDSDRGVDVIIPEYEDNVLKYLCHNKVIGGIIPTEEALASYNGFNVRCGFGAFNQKTFTIYSEDGAENTVFTFTVE